MQKTTTNGILVEKSSYAPFGDSIGPNNAYLGFSSEMAEIITGTIYYNYRYYGLTIARWSSRDPLEDYTGNTSTRFIDNNPIEFFDIYGLDAGNYSRFTNIINTDMNNIYTQEIAIQKQIINNQNNDCCINGMRQEKVTDAAGRSCCINQLRTITLNIQTMKNKNTSMGHVFLSGMFDYFGSTYYRHKEKAIGFYPYKWKPNSFMPLIISIFGLYNFTGRVYDDTDTLQSETVDYKKNYKVCPRTLVLIAASIPDVSNNGTYKEWNLFNFINHNCAGEAFKWLENGGIHDNWKSWLPFAHPFLW